MASEGTRHLFVLSFPEEPRPTQAVDELHELSRDMFIKLGDWAVITKGDDGALTVTENPTPIRRQARRPDRRDRHGPRRPGGTDRDRRHRRGAGIGAVAGALIDSGFKSKDLDEAGRLMEAVEACFWWPSPPTRPARSGACSMTSRPSAPRNLRAEFEIVPARLQERAARRAGGLQSRSREHDRRGDGRPELAG